MKRSVSIAVMTLLSSSNAVRFKLDMLDDNKICEGPPTIVVVACQKH